MKRIIILLLAVIGVQMLHAQRSSFSMAYQISFPVGDLQEYIGKTSFRGVSLEYNYGLKSNIDVGLEVGWNVFYERVAEKVYTQETASISGVQYRYANTVPIIAGAKYYKETSNSNLEPFVGLGLGTLYVDRDVEFGLYVLSQDVWQFAVRPELGVKIHIPGASFIVGGKYYAGFASSDMDGQSYVSINLGVTFPGGK